MAISIPLSLQPDNQWLIAKKAMLQGLRMYGDGLQRLEEISLDIIQVD